ncbi:MAG: uroporphyrinogen-III synthase [Pseudomonadota bacterium]
MPSNASDYPAILITRPQPEADALAERFRDRRVNVFVAPLFTIQPVEGAPLPPGDVLLLTSPRATRDLSPEVQKLPTITIGASTAAAAKDAGLHVIAHGDGSSDTLPLHKLHEGAKVLHLSGEDIARDLRPIFEAHAIPYHRVVTYKAQRVETLPTEATSFLRRDGAKTVTFFSVRAAEVFAQLVAEAGLDDRMRSVTAACFGPRIAGAARASLPYRSVRESEAGNVIRFVDFVSSGAS